MKAWLATLPVALLLYAPAPAGAEQLQSVNTINVVGVGFGAIPVKAAAAEADLAYHAALIQAVNDGALKAKLLAEAATMKLGPLAAISEDGRGVVICKNAAGEYIGNSYEGVEADSGTALAPTIAVEPAATPAPTVVTVTRPPAPKPARKKRRKGPRRAYRRFLATKASTGPAATCELQAEVQMVYDL